MHKSQRFKAWGRVAVGGNIVARKQWLITREQGGKKATQKHKHEDGDTEDDGGGCDHDYNDNIVFCGS